MASGRSSRSSVSSTSSLTRARAKAEAAKARLAYKDQEAKAKMERAAKEAKAKMERAAKEAEYQKEKADREAEYQKEKAAKELESQLEKARRDAELDALPVRREAAAAEAEVAVWEAADAMENGKSHPPSDSPEQEAINARPSTSQPPANDTFQGIPNNTSSARRRLSYFLNEPPSHAYNNSHPALSNDGFDYAYVPPAIKRENKAPQGERDHRNKMCVTHKMCHTDLNTSAQPFHPQSMPAANHGALATEHLAKYLARRDLVSSCLYQFDDKPERYRAWQSSYKNATQGRGLTATEELDLMTKWLGRESNNHVKRLWSVHVTNPVIALNKAWEHLQECYAAPEIIEKALFDRLDNFPRVSGKEHMKLRDLADLLMEVQCAKEDGYLPALSYLDTARGIGPIVAKLT